MLHSRGILKTPYPSFSPHWTNPSLQPPRMALSSESPSTPPLLLLRVPTVSPFLEMKCLPRPSPALVYTSLRPGSGLMMKECIISEPTAPWHLPVTSSEGPRTVAPLPLPWPPGHLGGRTEQPRASLRPSLTASPTSSPRPQPISSRPPRLCASCHTPSHPKHHQQTPLHPVTLSSDHAPPPSWVCTVVPLHPLNGPVFSYIRTSGPGGGLGDRPLLTGCHSLYLLVFNCSPQLKCTFQVDEGFVSVTAVTPAS